MPCISGNFGPAGLIIQAAIVPAVVDLASIVDIGIQVFPALVDTGANCTCITKKVVEQVGLAPIGKREMISASHVVATNNYLFNVGIPVGISQQPTGEVAGTVAFFDGINGMEFNAGPAQFEVLLGMDVIRRGVLSLGFDKHFTFCW